MTREAAEILERALKLPAEARASLAGSSLESLDDAVDEGVEEAWIAEIARRLDDVRSGRDKGVPWRERAP